MKKFEYKREFIPSDYRVDDELKKHGDDGWELAAIDFTKSIINSYPEKHGTWNTAYFKREIINT